MRLMFENSTVCHIVDELITRPMSISLGLVGLVPLVVIDNSDNFVSDRFLPGSLFPRLAFLVGCGVVFQRRV